MGILKLKYGTKEEYDQELVYDDDTLYFLYDTLQIFKGTEQYTNIIETNILWDYSDADNPKVYADGLDNIKKQGVYVLKNHVTLGDVSMHDVCILHVSEVITDGEKNIVQILSAPETFVKLGFVPFSDEFFRTSYNDTWSDWASSNLNLRISQIAGLESVLDSKADIISLATVATSGSYNDLTDTLTEGTGIDITDNTISSIALVINDYTI